MKDTKPWLLLSAFKLEVDVLIQGHGFESISPDMYQGKLGPFQIDIQICGQGKTQVALMGAKAILHKDYEGVILIGSCGALCPQVGDWVYSREVLEAGFQSEPPPIFKTKWLHEIPSELQAVRMLSIEKTITHADERQRLASQYDSQVVAWESAGFARLLKVSGKQGIEIRYVSDRVCEDLMHPKEFKKRIQDASRRLPFHLKRVLEGVLI